MNQCSGWGSYLKGSCYIESWSAAASRGITSGTGEGIGQAINSGVNNIDFKGAGKAFTDAASEAFAKIDLKGMGKKFGKFATEETNDFFKETKFDFDSKEFSAKFGKNIQEMQEIFLKNLDTGRMGRNFGDSFEKGFEGFDFSGRAETVGSEFKEAMDNFSWEIGEGIAKAVENMLTGIRDELIFNQLPYFLAAGALSTVVATGTPLAITYLYYKAKHNIGRPKLATEIKQANMFTPLAKPLNSLTSYFYPKKVTATFDNETTRRINEISKGMQNIRKNGGYFQNILFYGPGGTGKTMVSNLLADESAMSYIKMSGGDLAQYIKRGEHVTELNKLFDKMETSWRPWSSRPWVLFIDEAESLCRDRDNIPTAELLELQNAFLNRTGTQSKRFALVMATNRLEDLDPAVLSRIDHKIYIGPPAEAERIKIIKSYLPQFFSSYEIASLFTDELIGEIASQTEGFTGRSLFKLLNAIGNHRAMTDNNALTKELIMQTVSDFALQEKEVSERIKAKKSVSASFSVPGIQAQTAAACA